MTTLNHPLTQVHVANSTPYAWPWNGVLDPTGTAVVIVEPRGAGPALSVVDAEPIVSAVVRVVAAVRAAGGAVIHVRTAPPLGGPEVPGQLDLMVAAADVVEAVGIDGFYGSSLDALLRQRGIERMILVGSGLETSLHSTMRSANDRGFECLLVIDACLPYQEALVAASVSMIEMSGGIFGAVGHSADVAEAFASARKEQQ